VKGHVDAETLAAFREGLLRRRHAAQVKAHLAGCPQCAQTDAQLAGVTSLLASAPVPPMPAGLTARIEAALAAEAAARAAGAPGTARAPDTASGGAGAVGTAGVPAAAGTGSGDTASGGRWRPAAAGKPPHPASPRPPGRAHRRGGGARTRSWVALRVAAVTAAVAVIAGGGYGLSQLAGGGASTGTSASRAEPASGQGSRAASGGKAAASMPTRMSPHASLARPPIVSSGTRYQPQHLGVQVKAVLARYPSRPGPRVSWGSLPASYSTFVNLPACIRRVSGGVTPRLVDVATYRGRPAAVIVVPAAPNRVRVWVVGPACNAAASDVLAQTSVLESP
jgi:hypothetical protein